MADVFVKINNQDYHLSCKAGGEERLQELAAEVDEKVGMLAKQMIGTSNERLFLMAAIILADEKSEAGGTTAEEAQALKGELTIIKAAFKEMKAAAKVTKIVPDLPSIEAIKNIDRELKGAVEQINNLARKLESEDDFPH
jgi:cell division protein ZapA